MYIGFSYLVSNQNELIKAKFYHVKRWERHNPSPFVHHSFLELEMLYSIPSITTCADIGRVDRAMLTDQQMMELLFTATNHLLSRVELGGDECNACSWNGVTCSDRKVVEKILWISLNLKLEGVIDFSMIPRDLMYFSLFRQDLSGEIDTSALPRRMDYFCLEFCQFTGTVDIGSLPEPLRVFQVLNNAITGVANVSDLPKALEFFEIREENVRMKSLAIGALPDNSVRIKLQGCNIQSVNLENPKDAERVYI